MFTSRNSGWNLNPQKYSTATSIAGLRTSMTEAGNCTACGSQTTFVLPVQGTQGTSYLYMGDAWGESMRGTGNDSQHIRPPLALPTQAPWTRLGSRRWQ